MPGKDIKNEKKKEVLILLIRLYVHRITYELNKIIELSIKEAKIENIFYKY